VPLWVFRHVLVPRRETLASGALVYRSNRLVCSIHVRPPGIATLNSAPEVAKQGLTQEAPFLTIPRSELQRREQDNSRIRGDGW
jgi:hypothetical protein